MIAADIIIYAVIAAGLVIWLRNILGTKNGSENQRPNPFKTANNINPADKKAPAGILPLEQEDNNAAFNLDNLPANVQLSSDSVRDGLQDIARADRTFNPRDFTVKVQDAFALIIESFADGDRDMLKSLLAPSVYDAFDAVVTQRQQSGEIISTEVHAIRALDVLGASLKGPMAYITLRFTAEETCVIRNGQGDIISGHPDRTSHMTDVWTFGRNIRGKDPAWRVYETRDDVHEDHKTPLPDAGHIESV